MHTFLLSSLNPCLDIQKILSYHQWWHTQSWLRVWVQNIWTHSSVLLYSPFLTTNTRSFMLSLCWLLNIDIHIPVLPIHLFLLHTYEATTQTWQSIIRKSTLWFSHAIMCSLLGNIQFWNPDLAML